MCTALHPWLIRHSLYHEHRPTNSMVHPVRRHPVGRGTILHGAVHSLASYRYPSFPQFHWPPVATVTSSPESGDGREHGANASHDMPCEPAARHALARTGLAAAGTRTYTRQTKSDPAWPPWTRRIAPQDGRPKTRDGNGMPRRSRAPRLGRASTSVLTDRPAWPRAGGESFAAGRVVVPCCVGCTEERRCRRRRPARPRRPRALLLLLRPAGCS